jgi:hypothetical protein
VVYFNALILAKNAVETGQYTLTEVVLGLHGTVFLSSVVWLMLRSGLRLQNLWSSAR